MEDGPQILPPPTLEPISRPSSTSTSASASLTHLPGIQTLAAANAAISHSPQLKASAGPPPTMYAGASPAATSGGGSNMPTCQNCSTSTTPLWRRDEFGSVLCNACGLFLKLHGRARPISLKTDVIKSRNRVKTMRPDLAPKKKQPPHPQGLPVATDHNGIEIPGQSANAAQAARRASQKSNGHGDGSHSPNSRNGTPSMYPAFMVDDPYQSTGVSGFGATADGRAASPLNGDRAVDAPLTHEQLIANNSSLKTRVAELELIHELFRGRLLQLEQQEASARKGQEDSGTELSSLRSQLETSKQSEAQLRAQLDDSHRRENSLKRRLDDLELELKDIKDAKEALEAEAERPAKKPRLQEPAAKLEETSKEAPQEAQAEKSKEEPKEEKAAVTAESAA